jgi:hypothetical protein
VKGGKCKLCPKGTHSRRTEDSISKYATTPDYYLEEKAAYCELHAELTRH